MMSRIKTFSQKLDRYLIFSPFLALSRRGRSEECRSWIAVHLQDPRPGSSQVLVRWNRGMQKKCQDMPMGARPTRNQSVRCGHYPNTRKQFSCFIAF